MFEMSFFHAQAQTLQFLNSNNIIAGIGVGGNLFSDTIPISNSVTTSDLFRTKFDSGRAEIYTAALWLNGLDEGGNVCGSAQRFFAYGLDYYDGPITNNYDSAYDVYYKRVFKITQGQLNQFRSLNFPTTANLVDSAILYWPAKDNPSVLSDYGVIIDSPLAPFVDINGNGIYEPLLGDYPAVVGDQSIFFVFNDIRGLHGESTCTPLGVEIRGLASSFLDTTHHNIAFNRNAINNSMFIQYEVENKSEHTYSNFDLGFWSDPDVGCFDNDYVGCDSNRSLMFAYNGSNYDPSCGLSAGVRELGYDSLPVALGIQILSQPMDVFGYFKACQPNCLGMTDPVANISCAIFRNFLEGFWADGTPFTAGGDGYNSGDQTTKFCFPGDPNDSTQWSEVETHEVPGDRIMFGSSRISSFVPGQIIHYDLGFTTSFDSTSSYLGIIDTLKNDADSVRSFYQHRILSAQQVLGIKELIDGNQFTVSIYPNPANKQVTITGSSDIEFVELMDIEGRVLLRKNVGASRVVIAVGAFAKGVYLVNIESKGNWVVKKLVVD